MNNPIRKKENVVPYNGTPPKDVGTDPQEREDEGYGGDGRPGIWVSPKQSILNDTQGQHEPIWEYAGDDVGGNRCATCGVTVDYGSEKWDRTPAHQGKLPGRFVLNPREQKWLAEGTKSMKAIVKTAMGVLRRGDTVIITGGRGDKAFFYVEKDSSLVGIAPVDHFESEATFALKKQAAQAFLEGHKGLSKSASFIKKIATDFVGLVDDSVLQQLETIKDSVSANKEKVMNQLSVSPNIHANIRMADAAHYFALKGTIPTETDTIRYIQASMAAHTGLPESTWSESVVKSAIQNRKAPQPLEWSDKLMLMNQWHMKGRLPLPMWAQLQEVLAAPELNDIRVGVEMLFNKASGELQPQNETKTAACAACQTVIDAADAECDKAARVEWGTPGRDQFTDAVYPRAEAKWKQLREEAKRGHICGADKDSTKTADMIPPAPVTPAPEGKKYMWDAGSKQYILVDASLKRKATPTDYKGNWVDCYCGIIPGGRAGTRFQGQKIQFPIDATLDQLEEWADNTDFNVSPNQASDWEAIKAALKSGQTWAGCDVFGEGSVGFGTDKAALAAKVKQDFLNQEGGDNSDVWTEGSADPEVKKKS